MISLEAEELSFFCWIKLISLLTSTRGLKVAVPFFNVRYPKKKEHHANEAAPRQ